MNRLLVFFISATVVGAQVKWVQKERDALSWEERQKQNDANPSAWVLEGKVPGGAQVTMTVALKVEEDRRAMLEKIFWEVSDPKHEKYGQHLSTDDITKLLDVPQSRMETVKEYFKQAGATSTELNPNKDMITVKMPAAAVEKALNTKLGSFFHSEYPQVHILRAMTTYHLPADVADHVAMVGELLQFPQIRPKGLQNLSPNGRGQWPNACSAQNCDGLVTPAVLAQRYKFPASSNANAGSSMAVAEFQGQYFKNSDLSDFSKACHKNATVQKVDGDNLPVAGVEAELDIEYIKAVAPDAPLTVVYNSQYSLLAWANQITSMADPPLVHSVSYGNDEKQQVSTQYMLSCNTAFMKAGAKGISILFASGDQGVCGREGCGYFKKRFKPDFPAASPYITAVGGTDFAGDTIGDESAWVAGGGGFSDTFDMPEYQKDAVKAYLTSKDADLPPQSMWNSSGRAYPDVAALGGQKTPYCIASSGRFSGVAGTSASCPVVAGIFALLNGLRASKGQRPLGFLNPFIYQNPHAFQDVTLGTNSGGMQQYGFKAIKGWDAATGWGTPNYEALSKAVLAQNAYKMRSLVDDEGSELSAFNDVTISDCERKCESTTACHSFSFSSSGKRCHLKDKCVTASDGHRWNHDYVTYYKPCSSAEIVVV